MEGEILELIKNHLDADGKLLRFPSRYKLKIASLVYLSRLFEQGRKYTEREVCDILDENTAFQDCCTLRRELVEQHFLERKRDCTEYWLSENPPTFADYNF